MSLSYDARRIAHPYEAGYASFWLETYDATPAHVVGAGPAGSVWEVVDWSPWNSDVAPLFARFEQDKLTALANTNPYSGSRFATYELDTETSLLPVADHAASVAMASPVDPDELSQNRLTSPASHVLWLWPAGDPDVERGQIDALGSTASGYGACMADDETLAGPRGVPVQKHGPPSLRLHDRPLGQISDSFQSTLVYRVVDGEPVPAAVIRGDCTNKQFGFGRYDIPQSRTEATWTYLGPITDGESLMTRHYSGSDTQDLVLVGLDLEPTRAPEHAGGCGGAHSRDVGALLSVARPAESQGRIRCRREIATRRSGVVWLHAYGVVHGG